jgi:hypothetical protein
MDGLAAAQARGRTGGQQPKLTQGDSQGEPKRGNASVKGTQRGRRRAAGRAGSGSQIQGAEVDLLQHRVERRRPVGEFVGGVGAEPGYVGAQVGRKGGKLAGGDGPAFGDQRP